VTPDVWYVDGSGLLVGAERRWLLLDDVPDEAFVTTLWETIAGSSVDRVLGVLENHYGDRMPSLAMTGAGREISRGAGEVTSDRDGMMLSLGPPASSAAAGQRRPFRGGVVSAALVEIPVDVAAGRTGGPGLIDGIPDDVLAAVGPDIPVRARQTAREAARQGDRPDDLRADPHPTSTRPVSEVDTTGPIDMTREPPEPAPPAASDQTVVRLSRTDGPPLPVPEPEFELLREHTHETVMATYCPQGHVNPPYAPSCRVCQTPIARQDPQRAPRPLLGRLRLPTGETVPFDRGVVLGRKPVPVNPHAPLPHLVAVPQEASFVSRMHLQIELDGWLVICRDLGSRGGTTLAMPGRAPERLRAMEPHVLEPGCRVSLADQYEVAYEVTP
jgi:hypothetical protein